MGMARHRMSVRMLGISVKKIILFQRVIIVFLFGLMFLKGTDHALHLEYMHIGLMHLNRNCLAGTRIGTR